MLRSRYKFLDITPEMVLIQDIGVDCRSVTNDAKLVVKELMAAGILRPGMRLEYVDSLGYRDEITFNEHGLIGFKSISIKFESIELTDEFPEQTPN